MATKNTSITNTRIYADALKQIVSDVERLASHGLIRTPVRCPNNLVALIKRRKDSEFAYDEVKSNVSVALNDFCLTGNWKQGKDEDGEYIQFYLLPEKVMDEV